MSFHTAIEALCEAKFAYDRLTKVRDVYRYARRLSKTEGESIDWDRIGFFDNKVARRLKEDLRRERRLAERAVKAEFEMPPFAPLTAWRDHVRTVERKGAGSKEAKAKVKAYAARIAAHDAELRSLHALLDARHAQLSDRHDELRALRRYARRASETLEALTTTVPNLFGSGNSVAFFSLSRDMHHLSKAARETEKLTKTLVGQAGTYRIFVRNEIERTGKWIDALAADGRSGKAKRTRRKAPAQ